MLDYDRFTLTHLNDKSHSLIDKLTLCYIWISKDSNANHYSWSDTKVSSRLDYIFVSKSITLDISDVKL